MRNNMKGGTSTTLSINAGLAIGRTNTHAINSNKVPPDVNCRCITRDGQHLYIVVSDTVRTCRIRA